MASSSSSLQPIASSSQYDLDPTPISPLHDEVERPRSWLSTLPSSFFIQPVAAAGLGLFIGALRGGRRARLRFLAENMHRQPKTVQGLYFYTKTRNYRVLYSGMQQGGKYAILIGGTTGAFMFMEEYLAYARERYFGIYTLPGPQGEGWRVRRTWREGGSHLSDGLLSGTILGAIVGTLNRFPRQLFVRTTLFGGALGAVHSILEIARDTGARAKDVDVQKEVQRRKEVAEAERVAAVADVDRPVQPTKPVIRTTRDQTTIPDKGDASEVESTTGSLKPESTGAGVEAWQPGPPTQSPSPQSWLGPAKSWFSGST